jgi:hypothetical protein
MMPLPRPAVGQRQMVLHACNTSNLVSPTGSTIFQIECTCASILPVQQVHLCSAEHADPQPQWNNASVLMINVDIFGIDPNIRPQAGTTKTVLPRSPHFTHALPTSAEHSTHSPYVCI